MSVPELLAIAVAALGGSERGGQLEMAVVQPGLEADPVPADLGE